MAKQTKSAVAPVAPAGNPNLGAQAAARASAAKGDIFRRTLGKDKKPVVLEAGKRIAPQANVIVQAIEAAGEITRENLEKACTGVLVTRQPIGRIISYYQKDLQALGLITVTRAVAPATTEATAN